MARTKQKAMARAQPPKRKQPEAAPPKAGQEEGSVAAGVGYEQREKEQQDAGGGDVNKRRRTAAEGGEPQQVSEEEEGEEEYVFEWSRFAMVNDGGMDEVTRADTIPRCDEPVEEVLTKPGLALLNSLTGGTTGDSSTSVVAGSWYEDVEEGRARGEQVRLAFPESSVEARVYRAPSSSTDAQRDRFELTYLTTDDDLQCVPSLLCAVYALGEVVLT
jgi:hypothetical protein